MLIAALCAVTMLAGNATAATGAETIEVVEEQRLGPRLTELTVRTPAVDGPTGVRVLLPPGYDSQPGRRYPVLYLLHGGSDDFKSWTEKGDAEALTEGLGLIVVMPDSGPAGGYVDWYNRGRFGPPAWETYHVRQLIPFIDGRYRTIPTRAGRAVAGLSMGGGGSFNYASRHPDMFAHAAGFSAAVDTTHPGVILLNETGLLTGGGLEGPVFGSFLTQEVRWRGNNPVDLAENLRGLTISLRTGNGLPGRGYLGIDPIETAVHDMSAALHRRLDGLGTEHLWEDYGPGSHSWPYWRRDLRLELPLIMRTFANNPPRPRRFRFKAIEPQFDVYGWSVTLERPQLEFSRLESFGRRGFTLSGSGRAQVRTAPIYRRRALYHVGIESRSGHDRTVCRGDRRGRLRVAVPLGPANAAQQYTLAARLAGTRTFETDVFVRLSPTPRVPRPRPGAACPPVRPR